MVNSIRPNVAFRRLARTLREELRAGKWLPGQTMPSRRELAKAYDVTPNTVNKAIHELAAQGLLNSMARHGTSVVGPAASPRPFKPATAMPVSVGTVAFVTTSQDDQLACLRDESLRKDPWLGNILRAVETTLGENGVRLRMFRVWHDAFPTPEVGLAAALATQPVGLIVCNMFGFPGYDELLATHRQLSQLPTILLTTMPMSCPFPQLTYDQSQFGYVAGRHLVMNGYRRIVALRLCAADWMEERIRGVERAVRAAGLPYSCEVVSPAEVATDLVVQDMESTSLVELAVRVFDQAHIVADGSTAVLLPSDRMALALHGVLLNRGLRPGRDIGLIGFDDTLEGRIAGLTSVRPALEAMGAAAARRIMQGMTEGLRMTQETIPPLLMPRQSTECSRGS